MDIAELLTARGIETQGAGHKHGRDGWLQIDCPQCGRGSDKFHLGINTSNGAANCWQCGPHRLSHVLAAATGATRAEAGGWLAGLRLRPGRAPTPHTGRLVLPGGRVDLLDSIQHVDYLTGRGLDAAALASLWHLEAIHLSGGGLSWRVFIPIHRHGEIVSWTTRSIAADHPQRYKSAAATQEAIPHRSLLYGEDYARHAIIVVEGPVDVWAIGPGAVATCGLSYTPAQVLRMAAYPVRVICFDSTQAAQRRADTLAGVLAGYPGETHVATLEAEDAGAAGSDEITALREQVFGTE
jgi:hypothetical protein